MPFLFDDKTFVNDNIALHSQRMESKYTRFLEKSPTYVTYYSIDQTETTVDTGFQDVERVLGANSPIRFNKIADFPIFMENPVNVQTDLEDQGLDGSFSGEGVILPGTIDPAPNDYFVINHLGEDHAFVVDDFQLDTIKSNRYIRITFSIKDNTDETKTSLDNQTQDEYQFVLANVGTESRALIHSDDMAVLRRLEKVYSQIVTHYNHFFYDSKYNSYLYQQEDGMKVYDRFVTNFLNTHGLLNEKQSYDTKYLNVEDTTPSFFQQYERSLFRAVEDRDWSLFDMNQYGLLPIESAASVFKFYRDNSIVSVNLDAPFLRGEYLPEAIYGSFADEATTFDDIIWTLLHEYIHKGAEHMTINADDLERYRHWMRYNFRIFTMVPVVLYILRQRFSFFMKH